MLFSSSNNPVESVPGPVRSTLPPLSSLLRVDVDAHLVVPSLPILPNHPTMYKQHHLFGLQRCPKSLSHSLALPFLCREIAAVLKPAMCVLGGHGEQRLGDRFFQGLSRASLAAS